jgi:hypothetical protein
VEWIQLAQDSFRWRILANTAMNLLILAPQNYSASLLSLSRLPLLHFSIVCMIKYSVLRYCTVLVKFYRVLLNITRMIHVSVII